MSACTCFEAGRDPMCPVHGSFAGSPSASPVTAPERATSPCICEHAGPGAECVCHTSVTERACLKPMRGLYGAATTCARPIGHLGRHNPVWDYRDWPVPSPEQPAREQPCVACGWTTFSHEQCMYCGRPRWCKHPDCFCQPDIGCSKGGLVPARASVSADTPPTTLTATLPDGSVLDGHAPSPAPVTLDEPAAASRGAPEVTVAYVSSWLRVQGRNGMADKLDALLADRARLAARCERAEEALQEIVSRHPDSLPGEHPAVDIAKAALAAAGAGEET